MDRQKIEKGLASLHLPASWAEWVTEIEVVNERDREGPYRVTRPTPPELTYETIEEYWDGEEDSARYVEHTRTESEMFQATIEYEMALHRWVERHGDKEESDVWVFGAKLFSATLTGNGRRLELLSNDPEQGWSMQRWEWNQ